MAVRRSSSRPSSETPAWMPSRNSVTASAPMEMASASTVAGSAVSGLTGLDPPKGLRLSSTSRTADMMLKDIWRSLASLWRRHNW